MFVLHVHDRWSALGGADWHLVSLLDSWPGRVRVAGVFGRADGSVPGGIKAPELFFIKKLDKKAPFYAEEQVGRALTELIAARGPDLVHVHNILNPRLLEAAARTGQALITVQDHRFFCPGRGKVRADGALCDRPLGPACSGCFEDEGYFLKVLELVRARLAALGEFRAVITLSRYMKNELVQAGLDEAKIHVIPPFAHGLDQASASPASGKDVLFVGRVVWAKGIFDLLEALGLVDRAARLIIAGAGAIDEQVRARVRELGLENRVDFLGWTPHADLAGVYGRARLTVAPSRWQEPFGIVGLEAQSLGRPTVAYDVGGIRDWLEDGVTGLIAPPGDVPALASRLDLVLGDPGLAEELGRAGRDRAAAHFDRDVLMGRLIGLYRETAG
ncbi:MAG: glycosyltransferase family 4 protein [Pseudomonadota bacterium]